MKIDLFTKGILTVIAVALVPTPVFAKWPPQGFGDWVGLAVFVLVFGASVCFFWGKVLEYRDEIIAGGGIFDEVRRPRYRSYIQCDWLWSFAVFNWCVRLVMIDSTRPKIS
jgi:protein-S-isoprenylcysteine O-methyltransferase Ste14